jgi:hypothetical protein
MTIFNDKTGEIVSHMDKIGYKFQQIKCPNCKCKF